MNLFRFYFYLSRAGILGAALALGLQSASACTSFLLKAENGDYIYGRTLEFALPLQSDLIVIPRRLSIRAVGPDGKTGTGLSYKTKYGAIGSNGLGLPILVDGINEKGLASGMLFFPGLAEFQDVPPKEGTNSIASYEIVTYILTQFASVDEVRAGLSKIKVNRAPQAVFKMPVPIHVTVHDAFGKSVVVEYISGQLQITDNPTGIMTNAPNISWHLGNLAQYSNATSQPGKNFTINRKSFSPWSTGSGMNGLPGDMSSTSRFVQAAFYVANAPKIKDGTEGLKIAFHFLNQFDIPPGAVRTSESGSAGGGVSGYEVTEWTSAADLKKGIYQITTYANPQIRQISLKLMDLNAKSLRFISIKDKAQITDLSR